MNRGRYFIPFLLLGLTSCGTAERMNQLVEESTMSIHRNICAVQQSTEVIRENSELIDESTKQLEKNHKALDFFE